MALLRDETGARTQKPTPLRIAEARQRGQVARSSDMVSVALLLGGLVGLALWGDNLLAGLTAMLANSLSFTSAKSLSATAELGLAGMLGPVLLPLAGIVFLPLAGAILANVLQVGLLVSGDPVQPDLSRISPAEGLKRIFSLRTIVRLVLSIAKLLAVAGVCVLIISGSLRDIVTSSIRGPYGILAILNTHAIRLGFAMLAVLGVLAVIDLLYQRWQHMQDLKITRRELLDDLRRMEGDRRIAERRRGDARRQSSQRQTSKDSRKTE